MSRPRVAILTDGVADLPRTYIERFNVKVVPVYLMMEGQTYSVDGTTDDRAWFYRRLGDVKQRPTTAAPAPHEFEAAYRALASEGVEEIIALVTAAKVSSVYTHALVAARSFEGARVHVIDTEQVSMGIGWMVVAAGEWLVQGFQIDKIVERVKAMRSRTHILGVLDSIDYLRRSGRVGWAVGQVAALLDIKPFVVFDRGEARPIGRVRTQARALNVLIDRTRAMGPLERLAILHSRAGSEMVDALRLELAPLVAHGEVPVVDIGTVFATHVGPGCLGVAFVTQEG